MSGLVKKGKGGGVFICVIGQIKQEENTLRERECGMKGW